METQGPRICRGARKDGKICDNQLPDDPDFKFCPKCRTPIPPPARYCTGVTKKGQPCGFDLSQLDEDCEFCPKCGKPISDESSDVPAPTAAESPTEVSVPPGESPKASASPGKSPDPSTSEPSAKSTDAGQSQREERCPVKKPGGTVCNAELAPGTNSCARCAASPSSQSPPEPVRRPEAPSQDAGRKDNKSEEQSKPADAKSSEQAVGSSVDNSKDGKIAGARGDPNLSTNENSCKDRQDAGHASQESPSSSKAKPEAKRTEGPENRSTSQGSCTSHSQETPSRNPADVPLPKENEQETSTQHKRTYADVTKSGGSGSRANDTRGNNPQRKTAGLGCNTDTVSVEFIVIISDQFEVPAQKGSVYLRRGPDFDTETPVEMVPLRSTPAGWMYTGTVTMTREKRNKGFIYKYVIHKGDKKQTRQDWEYLQKKNSSHPAHRYFKAWDTEIASADICRRCDGIAYPKPSTWANMKTAFYKYVLSDDKIKQDANVVGKEFLPASQEICDAVLRRQAGCRLAEDYLQDIRAVFKSLRYPMLDSAFRDIDKELPKKCIHAHLVVPILAEMEKVLCTDCPLRTVALGMFVLLLKSEYSIDLDTKSVNQLCHSLLIRPDLKNKQCPDMRDLETHFPIVGKDKEKLAKLVTSLIDDSGGSGQMNSFATDPRWLCCVPLLHFLEGSSLPFQNPEPSANYRSERGRWWGLSSCERRKESFKLAVSNAWDKKARETIHFLETLVQAFAADPLLARTVIASLDFKGVLQTLQVVRIPVDAMAATLSHHIGIAVRTYEKPSPETLELLTNALRKITYVCVEQDHKRATPASRQKEIKCEFDLIYELFGGIHSKRVVLNDRVMLSAIPMMYVALDRMATEIERNRGNIGSGEEQTLLQAIKDVAQKTCQWNHELFPLRQQQYEKEMPPKHIQSWCKLLPESKHVKNCKLKEVLEKTIADKFEAELKRLPAQDKLQVFLKYSDQVESTFAEILNRLAFESLEEALHKIQSSELSEENVPLVSLLSGLLERKWGEDIPEKMDVLTFVITWFPMVNYLKRFKDQKSLAKMDHLAKKNIEEAMNCLDEVIRSVIGGKIKLKTLRFLATNKDRFLTVVDAAGKDRALAERFLRLRQHELQAYVEGRKCIDQLFDHCGEFIKTDDFSRVKEGFEQLQNGEDDISLADICTVREEERVTDLSTYIPVVNPWGVPKEILAIVPTVNNAFSSVIFTDLFAKTAEKEKTHFVTATFWDAFKQLWTSVTKEWERLCRQMIDGSVSLAEAEKVFNMFKPGGGSYRYNDIEDELKMMTQDGHFEWIENRIRQFGCYTEIKKYVDAAGALLQVRNTYNIGGDFEDIEKIRQSSMGTTTSIRDLDETIRDLCGQLKDMTPADIHCLKEFTHPRCFEFVSWLTKTMEEGLKELKVFVDLALISAGEDPMAVDRVNCFHAAATGFAPLIFTTIEGCSDLLKQCRIVFKNVQADQNLPQKLRDTSDQLEWFQDVQKSHGSVEKTSLSQVASIIARGVFKIASLKKGMTMDVREVIQLDVRKDENTKTPGKHYTYDELLDLQSRLMLVAGEADKGKEDVDPFIRIMDSMARLGKTYVQLCADGCVLFLNWAVSFLCDKDRKVCCTSEFSGHEMLKGQRGQQDLEDYIREMAAFLERCHNEWMAYVDKMRQEYPELNMYTVEQLVFLQQQLVKVTPKDVSRLVYPMLSLLKRDCTPKDLEAALEEAMDEVDKMKNLMRGEQQALEQKEEEKRTNKGKLDEYLRELTTYGYSKAMALKALEVIGEPDVTKGLDWCMDNDEDICEEEAEEAEETLEEKKEVGQKLTEWFGRGASIAESAIDWLRQKDTGEETLVAMIGNLSYVWKRFLETVTSSGADFLSLGHLGVVLQCLAIKDQREFSRSLPPALGAGSPNLVLCRTGEVLHAVTYMYMFPENSEAPLPQPDEVLMCTVKTTFEQTDIFLRRAFFGKKKKLYCLAFADNLSYDVGEKVEKKIKEYDSQTENPYQLVIVCTSENEYRAHIVAALGRYYRRTPAVIASPEVCKHLTKRFAGVVNRNGIQSASALDPEKLCVRLVKSRRSGVGKTLYKERLASRLKQQHPKATREVSVTIPLHCRVANTQDIAALLLEHTLDPELVLPRVIHIDISYQVQEGVDHLLYNLLVLGCVTDHHGRVWLRSPMDIYLVETMPLLDQQKENSMMHQIFEILPNIQCWSPKDSLDIMKNPASVPDYRERDSLLDDQKFRSEVFQRPFQYLLAHDKGQQPKVYQKDTVVGKKDECLAVLLKHCMVQNPSWSELTQFVGFLNKQLLDFENSLFCSLTTSEDLPGFARFVLDFLILMAQDFATRSLKISEQSLSALVIDEADIEEYKMKRTWEKSPHPYIFFNPDGHTMTFLGFSISPKTFDLKDQQTGQVLKQKIMTRELYAGLVHNKVPITENFDALSRVERLQRLFRAFGLREDEMYDKHKRIYDPDDTYELTTDNVMKILAIYMRFRCDIPVIVMGETGCGKTRLIKFLCALQTPDKKSVDTMVLVKVHGGTTANDIMKKVRDAEAVAQKNAAAFQHRPLYTVLFFDEANTTEAIGAIKEVMCDGTMAGKPISLDKSLKLVAACNPYRKHTNELIQRLENAGLGYHVDAEDTVDKLGRVPMRHLVYRVQPLPQSMLPQVWDFGQLDARMEELYIRQMVRRYVRTRQLGNLDETGMNVLCTILMQSQQFLRNLQNECSFVSLRDVERALTVISWFLRQAEDNNVLFKRLEKKLQQQEEDDNAHLDETQDSSEDEAEFHDPLRMTKALVLALAICYRAGLSSKAAFDAHIVPYFLRPFELPGGDAQKIQKFQKIIDKCQDVFLESVRLEENIARNQALKDNLFMMVVCIELRIPLFLVGKPGSSKSLAKTIVSDAMQGNMSRSELFRKLKQAQMVSFQCSPLATADGIQATFRQCSLLQEKKNKDTFVSVVVLDEVGLAEDSPKMALKTLHPLLEDGCAGDELPDDCKKVGFVGISNWALDPAKMNRGILVQRDVPDAVELLETAKGICKTQDGLVGTKVRALIPKLAEAYLKIFTEAKKSREFFGLRDFYSLVKMVYAFAATSREVPSTSQLTAAIRRNFGGLDSIDPMNFFQKVLPKDFFQQQARDDDPDCSPSGLIKAALQGDNMGGETRYLLLLSENYGGFNILLENLLVDCRQVVHIFGSSFPKDQEYTKICCNINRIKVCMETGQTVILLNLENLYESLYDALNQYYAKLGGERYVDLGLGTHRVKCRVHRNFRLIVVAEKQVVYQKFPIPLINRLEKHFLTLNNIMSQEQLNIAQELHTWTEEFARGPIRQMLIRGNRPRGNEQTAGDVFMGYHPETAPAVVLKAWDNCAPGEGKETQTQVLEESQRLLLWCATPDAAVRCLESEWSQIYHLEQQHENLAQYLETCLAHAPKKLILAQITTHSRLLTENERQELFEQLQLSIKSVTLLPLQAFDTEQQFRQELRMFFTDDHDGDKLLLVQCESGDIHQDLIKCAQYCMQDQMPAETATHHIVFIVQLPRVAGACFTGFLGGNWHCLHIDELRAPDIPLPPTSRLQMLKPATLFRPPEAFMETVIIGNQEEGLPATGVVSDDNPEEVVEDVQMELNPDDIELQEEREEGPLLQPATEETMQEMHVPPPARELDEPKLEDAADTGEVVENEGEVSEDTAHGVKEGQQEKLSRHAEPDVPDDHETPTNAEPERMMPLEIQTIQDETQMVETKPVVTLDETVETETEKFHEDKIADRAPGQPQEQDVILGTEEALPADTEQGVEQPLDPDMRQVLKGPEIEPPQRDPHPALYQPPPTEPENDLELTDRFRPEFVRQMLASCVQAAVALVSKDTEEGASRATRRITIMLRLISDHTKFSEGIHKFVWSILSEKEKHAYEPELWLAKEAAKLESVKRAGTFRRSWMMYLEGKIIPILASVIAYLDTSDNLEIMYSDFEDAPDEMSWKQQLWLNVLWNVCHSTYKHLTLPSEKKSGYPEEEDQKKDMKEFAVRTPGVAGTHFTCDFPFSWLVWEQVNRAITEAQTTMGDRNQVNKAGSVVEHSLFGKCLKATLAASEESARDFFQCYIADLLRFNFTLSPAEHKLMCKCMEKGLRQLKYDLMQLGVGQGLVLLHLLFEEMKPRLQAILDMDDHRPNAIHDLTEMAGHGTTTHLLANENEMTEDVALLTLLVEELQPSAEQFVEKEGRDRWTEMYSRVAPVIIRVLGNAATEASDDDTVTDDDDFVDYGAPAILVFSYGDKCKQQIDDVRCLWIRLLAVKLFLDYISPLSEGPTMTRKAVAKINLQRLWKLLERVQQDPKKKQAITLESVDRFLTNANTNMIKELLGEVIKCMYCESTLTSAPLELPCKHRLCRKCYNDYCPGGKLGECPQCHEQVPKDFDPTNCDYRDAADQLSHYQRQISGFLMALSSQLCFGGQERPEPDAIKHIISNYILHTPKGRELLRTKNMTFHDDVVDLTPVLRSFTLRLLLKHREKDVKAIIRDELLKKYKILIEQENAPQQKHTEALVQLSLLVIFCIEDHHHEQEGIRTGGTDILVSDAWILLLTKMLCSLQKDIDSVRGPSMNLGTLESLGRLRYILRTLATILHTIVSGTIAANGEPLLTKALKDLFALAKQVCESIGTEWPKKFLIKCLCREHGIQAYTDLVKFGRQEELLSWIVLKEAGTQIMKEEVADRYLVCGEPYKSVRDHLAQVQRGVDSEDCLQLLQNLQMPPDQKQMIVLLAVHREVTMCYGQPMSEQQHMRMVAVIQNFAVSCGAVQDKEFCQKLYENKLAPGESPLCVKEGQDMAIQSWVCLLTHFYLALRTGARASHLLYPLHTLIYRPEDMANAYLPTMPQDDFVDLMRVLNEQDRNAQWGEPKVYRCPNGHRYFIGECGRAIEGNTRCNECGLKIGGKAYNVPIDGNALAQDLSDQTRTGHILRAAAERGLEAMPERDLTPLECAITRFFLHAALYLGASVEGQTQAISGMVQPRIAEASVCQFFWDHIKRDMDVLQRVTGRNFDEVCVMLHVVCHNTAIIHSEGDQARLQTKEERRIWEREFARTFVKPVTLNIEGIIVQGNNSIIADKRQGENHLLNLAYEVEDSAMEGNGSLEQLHTSPSVWCYRPRITIDHFFREFQSQVEAREDMKDKFPIIRLFKSESLVLRALHYLPAILDSQKRLMAQLHRRLDRAEAATLTIQSVMGREDCEGLEQLFESFAKAWEVVKERLITYTCLAPLDGLVSLPEDYHNKSITVNSPLAVLLPATRGPGLCAYILLQYLLAEHNDFMKRYCPLLKQHEADFTNRYNRLPKVHVRKVSARHLVGYSPDGILPLVLSSCNYSLKLGHTTTMEYDFATFQKHLVDTVFQCKSRVQRHEDRYFPIETMVYRADTSSSRLFKSVRDKIGQEALTPAERRQIREDLRGKLPDICQSIDHLNTSLSFLKALGGDPESSLHEFMARSLQMEHTIHSRKAQQLCSLKHVQSLWILLCHERASVLATYNQDAFDEQEKELREPLTKEQEKELKSMCDAMSVDRLELLLLHLFECIMLRLSQPPDDEFYQEAASFSLFDELITDLVDVPFYTKEPVEVQTGLLTADDLTAFKFPKSLEGRHSTNTWLACRKHLAAKKQEFQ